MYKINVHNKCTLIFCINCQINAAIDAQLLLFVQYAHACACAFLGIVRHHGSDSTKECTITSMCIMHPQSVVALVDRLPDRQRPVTTPPVASFCNDVAGSGFTGRCRCAKRAINACVATLEAKNVGTLGW